MQKVILKIGGMSCSACQNKVEKYLNKQDGVKASVNLVMAQALIEYDETKVALADLERFVRESGYASLGIYDEKKETKKDNTKVYLILLAFLGVFLMYVSMGHMLGLPVIPILHMLNYPINYGVSLLILTIPFLIFGQDIIRSGLKKLIHLSPNMDSLVAIGVLSSLLYSLVNLISIINGNVMLVENLYFESSAMIIYFIKLGRFIDKNAKEKTKEAIEELVQITPEVALIKSSMGLKEVTIDEVKKGDILVCKPGMKVACDGKITKGSAHFDEAFITGEAAPVKKDIGDEVLAGSINSDGYIEYKALKIGPDSTISEIVRLVVEATNTKAPIGRLADKVSGYFVPGIVIIAILTLIGYLVLGFPFNEAIVAFVTVLVVACPCALGLATPLALVVSVGACAKRGILIKTNETLENAHNITTLVFDKTGTLTYGKLRIAKVYNYSKLKEQDLLTLIASLESLCTHPIASAFKNYASSNKRELLSVSNFKNLAGVGISGIIQKKEVYVGSNKLFKELGIKNNYQEDEKHLACDGCSILYVIESKKVLGLIGVKDIVRDKAASTISKLKKLGKEVIMLSGDNIITAQNIAKSLGIDEVVAECRPQDKEKYLVALKESGKKIMMVGDGINDAPAIASADIGISLGGGTEVALNSADVILINDDITKIPELINISQKTIRIIKQNLFWAFFYNILMIPLAIGLFKGLGLSISPMVASIAMTLSSLTVVFNSLRLKGGKK